MQKISPSGGNFEAGKRIRKKEYEKKKLVQRIASAHAEYVLSKINQLSCSAKQKSDLLRAVIEMAKNQKSL